MPLPFIDENWKKAYCQSLACTGIGAAVEHCDDVLPEKVIMVVPQHEQDTFPNDFLNCVRRTCTNDPYGWSVENSLPAFDDNTTFQDLYDDWFLDIISN